MEYYFIDNCGDESDKEEYFKINVSFKPYVRELMEDVNSVAEIVKIFPVEMVYPKVFKNLSKC